MKFKLSRSKWEEVGKKAGWMKKAQTASPAQGIENAFKGLSGGFENAAKDKAQEYA